MLTVTIPRIICTMSARKLAVENAVTPRLDLFLDHTVKVVRATKAVTTKVNNL